MYRRSVRGRVLLLVFVALSITIITLDVRHGSPALERAKDVSEAVIAPIQRGFTAVVRPIGNFFSSLGELEDLRAENAELSSQLEFAQSENEQASAIASENRRLAELLELQKSWGAMDTVAAQVFSRSGSNFRWAVSIDKGRADGLRPDMAVVAPEGLVGKILRVQEHTATVLLLIDPEGAAAARLTDKTYIGTVKGNGGSENLSLDFIGTRRDVNLYDEVVTAGYDGGIFPPGIPIGVVVNVGGESSDLDQDIHVEPYVDFIADLDYVLVLLETGPRLESDNERSRREEG